MTGPVSGVPKKKVETAEQVKARLVGEFNQTCSQAAAVLSSWGYKVPASDIRNMFLNASGPIDINKFNDFFAKYINRLEASQAGFQAYFNGSIADPQAFLKGLKDLQEIAAVTGDNPARMIKAKSINMVSRDELTAMAKNAAKKYKDSARITGINDQLMRMKFSGQVDYAMKGTEFDDHYYYLMGMSLLFNRSEGMLGYLWNRETSFNGINLENPRVLKEFSPIFDAFVSDDANAPDLKTSIEALKKLSKDIARTEEWLKGMEDNVNAYIRREKMATGTLSLNLTPADYRDDKVWEFVKKEIVGSKMRDRFVSNDSFAARDSKELYDVWMQLLKLRKTP